MPTSLFNGPVAQSEGTLKLIHTNALTRKQRKELAASALKNRPGTKTRAEFGRLVRRRRRLKQKDERQ